MYIFCIILTTISTSSIPKHGSAGAVLGHTSGYASGYIYILASIPSQDFLRALKR